MGAYTNIDEVSFESQVNIDAGSNPSRRRVENLITKVEKTVDHELLGSYTDTTYLNVGNTKENQYNGPRYDYVNDKLTMNYPGGVIIPIDDLKQPVNSITTLWKNDQSMTSAPDWEELTKWDGSSASDWGELKTSDGLVKAIYIFNDGPELGFNRIKVTYTYGYNIDEEILGEFCSKKVAIQVVAKAPILGNRIRSGYDQDSYIEMMRQNIEVMRDRCNEIKETYFPTERKKRPGVAIFQ